MRYCFQLLLLALFCGSASAQTAFGIGSFTGSGTFVDNDYSTAINGTGTATLTPGGSVPITITGTNTRNRGLSCTPASIIQLTFTFQLSSTDTITALYTANSAGSSSSVSGTFNITGGTGLYAGIGGTGSLSLSVTTSSPGGGGSSGGNAGTFTATGTGTGSITSSTKKVPSILPSGVVPIFSEVPVIQPGSWISIYGSNLANTTTVWNNDFPQSLGGVTVAIDGKPGFLYFVSPGLIDLQAPDDVTQGCVNVTVNTPNGTVSYGVVIEPQGPSLNLWPDNKHAAAIIYTSAGFDYLAPAGSISGLTTRPVKVGETISLFGVGFGPLQTFVPAGQVYINNTGNVNYITDGITVTVGGVKANVLGAALSQEGQYLISLTVPQVPSGDQLIQATLQFPNPILGDNTITQNNVSIAVQ